MALEVIGAGFSRTATFSLKFALEHLGFGPCHHFSEIFAGGQKFVEFPVIFARYVGKLR